MRVVLTGATGFIGTALVRALRARGDSVAVLTRRPSMLRERFGDAIRPIQWHPGERGPWMAQLADFEAVINLAGRPAVGVRYDEAVKSEIRDSRVLVTQQLVGALAELRRDRRPKVLVSASAVGYYGNRAMGELADESTAPGQGFLAEVCVAWERAAAAATAAEVRVVTPRIGIVLGANGGALQAMRRPFQWFLGGPIGSGRQAVSWIHLQDLVRIFMLCIDDARFVGAVNATAPMPVDNLAFSKAVGATLGRPAWLPVPASILRWVLGEGAEPLLEGQPAAPIVLAQVGFEWKYPTLSTALAEALRC